MGGLASHTTYRYVCMCACMCECMCVYMSCVYMNPWKASSPWHLHLLYVHILQCSGGNYVWCPLEVSGSTRWWRTSPSTASVYIHREPGAGHAGEWGCSAGDEYPHTHTNTSMYMQAIVHADIQERTEGDYLSLLSITLCVLIASLPSGAQQGCTCPRAPPTPHHSGLFWGEDSWNWGRNGQYSHVVWSVETLFVVIQVALEPLIITRLLRLWSCLWEFNSSPMQLIQPLIAWHAVIKPTTHHNNVWSSWD